MKAIALLLVAACATSSEPAPVTPTKAFDFAPRAFGAAPRTMPGPGASPKVQLRALIDHLGPELAKCSPSGTLDLSFTLALAEDSATIESDTTNACARDVLLAIDPVWMLVWMTPPPTPERWTVHAQLYTGNR